MFGMCEFFHSYDWKFLAYAIDIVLNFVGFKLLPFEFFRKVPVASLMSFRGLGFRRVKLSNLWVIRRIYRYFLYWFVVRLFHRENV